MFRYGLFCVANFLNLTLLPVVLMPLLVFKGYARWMGRLWQNNTLFLIRHILGIDYRIDGGDAFPQGCLIACKHQSQWETLLTTILFPENRVVAKEELKYIPIFGWYLWRIGTVFLDRSAHVTSIKKLIRDGRSVLAAGNNLLIYPEGTRTKAGEPSHYQPGISALYTGLGVPVVPVALNSGFFWPRKAFRVHPGTITVKILAPIQPGLDKKTFMQELENRIESACLEINDDARRQLNGERP